MQTVKVDLSESYLASAAIEQMHNYIIASIVLGI